VVSFIGREYHLKLARPEGAERLRQRCACGEPRSQGDDRLLATGKWNKMGDRGFNVGPQLEMTSLE